MKVSSEEEDRWWKDVPQGSIAEEAMPACFPGNVDILDELLGEGEEMVIDVPERPREGVPPVARTEAHVTRWEVSCQTDSHVTTLAEVAQEVARLQTLIVVEVSGLRRQMSA
jgi:hypothetical protein